MQAEIITIGDEILIGQIIDSNSAWMAQQLNAAGIHVRQIRSISDTKEHIIAALESATKKAQLILLTGGLGPTKDDITKKTLSEYFKSELVLNPSVVENLEEILGTRGKDMVELNINQAEVPACCTVLNNKVGTAPGMWFQKDKCVIVSMPGVPSEMKWLMDNHVLPRVIQHFESPTIVHRTVLTHGLPESVLAEKIKDWQDNLPKRLKLAYLPSAGVIRLRISVVGENESQINTSIDEQIEKLQKLIPDLIFGYGIKTMEEVVGELLKEKQAKVSTAESCTGGNIAHLITSISGSSEYFNGSIVAYSNSIKQNILHVKAETLEKHGAVSEEVVYEMAKNVKEILNTDYSISVSGIAGPGGATQNKPVGTIWIAVATPTKVITKLFKFSNNRKRNIRWATLAALNMLRLELLD